MGLGPVSKGKTKTKPLQQHACRALDEGAEIQGREANAKLENVSKDSHPHLSTTLSSSTQTNNKKNTHKSAAAHSLGKPKNIKEKKITKISRKLSKVTAIKKKK
jgi:hypothetical protein